MGKKNPAQQPRVFGSTEYLYHFEELNSLNFLVVPLCCQTASTAGTRCQTYVSSAPWQRCVGSFPVAKKLFGSSCWTKPYSNNLIPVTFSSNIFPIIKTSLRGFDFPIPLSVSTISNVFPTSFSAVLIQLFVEMCCKLDDWNYQNPFSKVVLKNKKETLPLILVVIAIRVQPKEPKAALQPFQSAELGGHWAAAVNQVDLQSREPNVQEQGSNKLFYSALP